MTGGCGWPTKYALDYNTINKALTLGHSHITGSVIPENFEFYEKLAPPVYDPDKAKQLLAEAGHAGGFDAGFYTCDVAYANLGEAALNYLRRGRHPRQAAAAGTGGVLQGLRRQEIQEHHPGRHPARSAMPRRGWRSSWSRAATTPMAAIPEIDELFPLQAVELDRTKRAAILTKMQHLLDDRTMYVPIWQLAFISGVGPRVAESGLRPDQGLRLYRALRRNHAEERIEGSSS